jgi:DNA-binding transcriptional MerR regulator
MLSTSEVLDLAPGLSRDLLYFWERKGWITPNKRKRGSKQEGRDYPISEARKAQIMWSLYKQGHTPEHAYSMARVVEQMASVEAEYIEKVKKANESGAGADYVGASVVAYALAWKYSRRGLTEVAEPLCDESIRLYAKSNEKDRTDVSQFVPWATEHGVDLPGLYHEGTIRSNVFPGTGAIVNQT